MLDTQNQDMKHRFTNLQYSFLEIFYKLCSIIFTASIQRYKNLGINACRQTNSMPIVCSNTKSINFQLPF